MRPTPAQLARYTAELHVKHDHLPGMAARIDRAAALAAAGDVRRNSDRYVILSSRNDGTGYALDDHASCTCPDCANGAPQIQGAKFCKHRLAFTLHHRALVEALAARILGQSSRANRLLQESHLNTFLLLIAGDKGKTALWSDHGGLLARVTWSTPLSAWQPATVADKITIETWLDHAAPLPTPGLAIKDEDALSTMIAHADAIARDAEVLPFPTWRDLYRPLLEQQTHS